MWAQLCVCVATDMRKWFPKAAEVLFGPEVKSVHPDAPSQEAASSNSGSSRSGGEEESARVRTIDDLNANANRVLVERPRLDGGLQSLSSSKQQLQRDEDGDEAHEFLVIDERPGAIPRSSFQGMPR